MKAKSKKSDENAFMKNQKGMQKCLYVGNFAFMSVTMYIFNIKVILSCHYHFLTTVPPPLTQGLFNLSNKAVVIKFFTTKAWV